MCVVFEIPGREVSIFASEGALIAVCWDGEIYEKKFPHVDDIYTLSINGVKRLSKTFYEEILIHRREIENGQQSAEQQTSNETI